MPDDAEVRALLAALEWQIECGADEAIGDAPVDRRTLPAAAPKPAAPKAAARVEARADPGGDARAVAAAATDLDGLRAAMAAYEGCELKRGARNLVFSGGNPGARVMIVGDAPDRDDDRAGRPFSGPAGTLLQRMFAAIGLERDGLYLAAAVPWRPPSDREPDDAELDQLRPFLARHVELAAPQIVVAAGETALRALAQVSGDGRARGTWHEAAGRPVLPMLPPAYLMRHPEAKREAWMDLLTLAERLG